MSSIPIGGNKFVLGVLNPEDGVNFVVLHSTSNGNASETKANESFNNGVFFDIEAKRTPSLESKLIFETKRTH